MDITPYETTEIEPLVFSFISESKDKRIEKLIMYDPIEVDLYNLAFGDRKNKDTLDIDDKIVSNNNDFSKIFSTIVHTFPKFFEKNPASSIFFQGSTKQRTKVYGWIISRRYKEFNLEYDIFGGSGDSIENFVKLKEYEYYIIQKK